MRAFILGLCLVFVAGELANGQSAQTAPPNTAFAPDRVPRGKEKDPGWGIQVLQRMLETGQAKQGTPVEAMLKAYTHGEGEWTNPDGSRGTMEQLGLPGIDWNLHPFRVVHQPDKDTPPFVHVERQANQSIASLSPTEIADGLLCGITFVVLHDSPENSSAASIDFFAAQVELYGGTRADLLENRHISNDTFLDIWAGHVPLRYTITRWQEIEGGGHKTVQVYGPLLYQVLDAEPEFIFWEDTKIATTARFKKGCRELCNAANILRREQGQAPVPVCRPAR